MAAAFLPRLPAAATARSSLLLDLRAGATVLLRSPGILGAGFLLNAAMNLMNVRSPLFMQRAGRGAADYAAFEMLISGGVLPGILLVAPLARRLTMNGVLSLGRWVVLAGSARPHSRQHARLVGRCRRVRGGAGAHTVSN